MTMKRISEPWINGALDTPAGPVPRVSAALRRRDMAGALLARLGIGRMRYRVEPGLYALGDPTGACPVFVSANYKLSFDILRRELSGLDAWILVLDTKGINVWCAAGKGTFGTEELLRRLGETRLAEVVSHRLLILPQLGAPGVAAHEVKKRSGFRVVYGPVRAADIPGFMAAGMRAAPEMRRVRFGLRERAAVVPVEVGHWSKFLFILTAAMFFLSGLRAGGYSFGGAVAQFPSLFLLLIISFLAGTVAVPLLLPWLPGRAFSLKGASAGVVAAGLAISAGSIPTTGVGGVLEASAWVLLITSIAAFLALNFTGSTTFTSLSGVRREMRVAIPVEAAAAAVGLGLWIAARFFRTF